MERVLGVILGGGQGTRLFPLTKYRAKPAVPIGGKYRLIDIPISNCLHAGLERMFVLTQFNSASLHRHIYQTYRFDTFSGGFVEILAAEQTRESTDWYQGTADAVRRGLWHMVSDRVDQLLILSGDHLYRMDYRSFASCHRDRGADVTIAVKPVTREAAPGLGILKVDEDGWVVDFHEKPSTPDELEALRTDSLSGRNPEEVYLASMGIYVFEAGVLVDALRECEGDDFGRDIIPHAIRSRRVAAYLFDGYWEDIGTIRSFYEANLALTDPDPPFVFHLPEAPIYTHPRYLAASRLDGCGIRRSIVGDGSDVRETEIERSVIGVRSMIGPNVRISRTVTMGADFYETESDLARSREEGVPNVGIGRGCVIEGAIIDKNARIGEGVVIRNDAGTVEADEGTFVIRDGVVVIPKNTVIPAGTVI